MKAEPVAARFERYTVKGPACWEWSGARDANGYGRLQVGRTSGLAHRVSWELAHGAIPTGQHVLHRCDNRRCVRPDHLFIGVNADNVADRVAKGRSRGPAGTRNAKAKLTEDDVAAIRRDYRPSPIGRPPAGTRAMAAILAERYGVTRATIYHIARGWNWKD